MAVELANVRVHSLSKNRFYQNCFVIQSKETQTAVVIDPGYGYEAVKALIHEYDLEPKIILATHAHFDHIASVAHLQDDFSNPDFFYHPADEKIFDGANTYTLFLKADKIRLPSSWQYLSDGDRFSFDSETINVHHTPGHTPGGCVFQLDDVLFTGDLLLNAPEKQHRLPGFDLEDLKSSRAKIFSQFPLETVVFPGHGKITTLFDLRQRVSP